MKKLQQFLTLTLVLCISAVSLMIPAAAAGKNDGPQVTGFEDGSYMITTIEYDQTQDEAVLFAAQSVKSGTKNSEYYSASDELVWVFRVHGTFTYDGSTAKASAATYSYDIYDSSWSFVKGSASYSGAAATATGSFKLLLLPNSVTLTLTCSPTGKLS